MSTLRTTLLVAAALLVASAGSAAPLQMSINITKEDRQFLLDNQQMIAIAMPSPVSGDGAAVVVALMLRPVANRTQVVFDAFGPAATLYAAHPPVAPYDRIAMALQAPVADGQAYSFNGAAINGNGAGVAGAVLVHYDGPATAGPPVVVGVAGQVHDAGLDPPPPPVPLNYYVLNRNETRLIPQVQPVAWIFICSDMGAGTVLPQALLQPTPQSSPASQARAAFPRQMPALQIGPYLSVRLDAGEQTDVYFDSGSNAFGYAPPVRNNTPPAD